MDKTTFGRILLDTEGWTRSDNKFFTELATRLATSTPVSVMQGDNLILRWGNTLTITFSPDMIVIHDRNQGLMTWEKYEPQTIDLIYKFVSRIKNV